MNPLATCLQLLKRKALIGKCYFDNNCNKKVNSNSTITSSISHILFKYDYFTVQRRVHEFVNLGRKERQLEANVETARTRVPN